MGKSSPLLSANAKFLPMAPAPCLFWRTVILWEAKSKPARINALAFARREWHSAENERKGKMAGVKQSRDGAVGILTLNEPESLNAMTPDLLGALTKAVAEMTADPAIRALVLTGEGRGFCSGQNLKAFE